MQYPQSLFCPCSNSVHSDASDGRDKHNTGCTRRLISACTSYHLATPNLVPRTSSSSMYPDRCLRGSMYRYLCHTSHPPSLLVSDVLSPSFSAASFFTSLSSLFSAPQPRLFFSSHIVICGELLRCSHSFSIYRFLRGKKSCAASPPPAAPFTPGTTCPAAANLRLFGRDTLFLANLIRSTACTYKRYSPLCSISRP
jgi:hypothetical protein